MRNYYIIIRPRFTYRRDGKRERVPVIGRGRTDYGNEHQNDTVNKFVIQSC